MNNGKFYLICGCWTKNFSQELKHSFLNTVTICIKLGLENLNNRFSINFSLLRLNRPNIGREVMSECNISHFEKENKILTSYFLEKIWIIFFQQNEPLKFTFDKNYKRFASEVNLLKLRIDFRKWIVCNFYLNINFKVSFCLKTVFLHFVRKILN